VFVQRERLRPRFRGMIGGFQMETQVFRSEVVAIRDVLLSSGGFGPEFRVPIQRSPVLRPHRTSQPTSGLADS
jgi:hypothetical protein